MAEFKLSIDWLSAHGGAAALRETTGELAIHLDTKCLTRNEDVWSSTVRDTVLVSGYPLALWLASSWWRLNFEPLPQFGVRPDVDWRMAHELGAANQGYVWPRIILAADGESMNIWAEPITEPGQSIQYLYGLDRPQAVSLANFQREVDGFIERVLARLQARGHRDTELAELWALIQEERVEPEARRYRTLEAQFGYDPDDCPESMLDEALRLQRRTGVVAMSELAPVFGRSSGKASGVSDIASLAEQKGVEGQPSISAEDFMPTSPTQKPWERGIEQARQLRQALVNKEQPINNLELYELLGITEKQLDDWSPAERSQAAIAERVKGKGLRYMPRKRHPVARRFELARLIGEVMSRSADDENWLVSTDIATAMQKRQRAFAAEFLCPIDSLLEYLEGDYSENAFEGAANHFDVSEKTIESLLANHGYLSSVSHEPKLPYFF